jgi:hypothetical protein
MPRRSPLGKRIRNAESPGAALSRPKESQSMGSKAMRKELPGGEFVEATCLRCGVSSPVLTFYWSGLAFEVVQFGTRRAAAAQLGR